MKSKSLQQRREALESVAAIVHAGLLEARRLVDEGEATLAFVSARTLFPMAVWVADRRWFGPAAKAMHRRRTTKTCTMAMQQEGKIDPEMIERLSTADQYVSTDWGECKHATTIIDTALAILEASESNGCRRRRERPAQEPRRRFSLRQWATAATGLFTVGAGS